MDIRAGAHNDWGSVTLLFQEEGGQPGLEIFSTEDVGEEGKVELMSQVNLTHGEKSVTIVAYHDIDIATRDVASCSKRS